MNTVQIHSFIQHTHGHSANDPFAQSIPDRNTSSTEISSEDVSLQIKSNPRPQDYSKKIPFEQTEEIIQDWEGVVDTIDEKNGFFTALMRDLITQETSPSEVVEILIQDIDDDDRPLIVEGAVFQLTVVSSTGKGGRHRFERIAFRRQQPRVWTESELLRAQERAQRIIKFFGSGS